MSFEFGKGPAGGSIEFIAPKAGSNLGRCNRLRFEIQFAEITAGYILDKVKKRTLANQRWGAELCPKPPLTPATVGKLCYLSLFGSFISDYSVLVFLNQPVPA